MPIIPKTHPRVKSLLIREKLVKGFNDGLVAKEGLLAHGRGEAFDYILGEKTTKSAKSAINAAAASMLLANSSVISVNGNVAALCSKDIQRLAKISNSKIEVNLFYANKERKLRIVKSLKKEGITNVLGDDNRSERRIYGIDSARRIVDKDGIFTADLVLVPLEDGDRTLSLKRSGKIVITFDLNPLSRTAQNADITIVDNIVRGIKLLVNTCKKLSKKDKSALKRIVNKYDNKKILAESITQIQKDLKKRGGLS